MERVALGQSGCQTTRLGFGCSSLMGATSRSNSLALLESAYDAGIRHFDVAPMYGYGEAESCLGDFLQRHRAEVTVTTKYGIPPAKNSSFISLARHVAGPIVRHLPGLKQRLASVANAATRNEEKATFTAEQASASLQRSLAALRTNHINIWLLHEVEAQDLQDDGLLQFLEAQVRKGIIGTFGIGSGADKVGNLIASRPEYCRTLQYEWSILDAPILKIKPFRIHHRALTSNFRSLHAALKQRAELCRRWSTTVGADLSDAEQLAQLMLKASLVINPNSVILFSSKNPQHIQTNVHVEADRTLEAPARQLYKLVQAERNQLFLGAESL